MEGQNAKFICQTWTFLVEFDVVLSPSKEIDLPKLGTKQQKNLKND